MKRSLLITPPAAETLLRIAVLLLFALVAVSLWPATLDDSFISYRYARNWVEGHGLVFNPGERVEGYSNLLWVLLLAPFLTLGLDIETISKLLGVVCGMGILLIMMQLLRRHFRASRTTVLLMGAWLATHIGFVYYAISGLETLFYTLQVMLLIHLLLQNRHGWAALVSATLLITRPEGMLFILPLALSARLARKHPGGGRLAFGKRSLWGGKPNKERSAPWWFFPAMPLLALGLATLWRWSYYGALLPNTFNAKIKTHWGVLHYIFWHSQTFINYAYKSFAWNEWVLILAAFYGLFLLRRRDLAPAAILGCLLFFIWFSGSDWMSFGRFYVPALPVLGLFAGAGLERVLSALARQHIRGMRVWIWLTLPILFNLVTVYYADEELTSGTTINPAMHSRPHRAIGLWLKDYARQGDTLVVNEIGAIGWYSGLPIIDMIGLTDRTIPRYWKNGNFAEYAGYILAQKPRFIALNDRQSPADEGMDPVHHALFERMQRAGEYRLLHTFSLTRGKNLLLFERRGP